MGEDLIDQTSQFLERSIEIPSPLHERDNMLLGLLRRMRTVGHLSDSLGPHGSLSCLTIETG